MAELGHAAGSQPVVLSSKAKFPIIKTIVFLLDILQHSF